MVGLLDLSYKDEIESLKEKDNFEALGDELYLHHCDFEARLYWAYCRPSGSSPLQIEDPSPSVSIMAFNHSRLPALERFKLLHHEVIDNSFLRAKIQGCTKTLFTQMINNDFTELNLVLNLVPDFTETAVKELKYGIKNTDININEKEATKFLQNIGDMVDQEILNALYLRLPCLLNMQIEQIQKFFKNILKEKNKIDKRILNYYQNQIEEWLKNSSLHLLQKHLVNKLLIQLD